MEAVRGWVWIFSGIAQYKELVALLRELNLDLTLLLQIIYYTNQWVDSLCINI